MVLYVAFVALLNLGLGYALAVYLGAGRTRIARPAVIANDESYSEDYDEDDYESDESYEDADEEYETAVS